MRLCEALQAYQADRLPVVVSEYRLRSSVRLLESIVGDRVVEAQADMAAAVAHYLATRLKAGGGSATVRRELITLKAAVRRAWKAGEVGALYYVHIPPAGPSRQRWLPPAEARRLLAAAAPELRLVLLLGLCTGARLSAICELTWDRVDLQLGTIDFRTVGSPRRKHRAVAPIAQPLRLELQRIRPQRPGRRPLVTLSQTAIRRRLARLAASLRLPHLSPHALRHTVATWLLSGGTTELVTASRLIGHRSTLITEQVYAHILPRHLQAAADVLGDTLQPRSAGKRGPSSPAGATRSAA